MQQWPSVDTSSMTIYPQYDTMDPARYHVAVQYWILTKDPRTGRWAPAKELERGWETGRTHTPTKWIAKGQTEYDNPNRAPTLDYFQLVPGIHYVYTKLAWRSPNSSKWQYSSWMATGTYQNVTYSGDWGFPNTKHQTACDTRPNNDVVVLRPA